jgi:hypothetical protein
MIGGENDWNIEEKPILSRNIHAVFSRGMRKIRVVFSLNLGRLWHSPIPEMRTKNSHKLPNTSGFFTALKYLEHLHKQNVAIFGLGLKRTNYPTIGGSRSAITLFRAPPTGSTAKLPKQKKKQTLCLRVKRSNLWRKKLCYKVDKSKKNCRCRCLSLPKINNRY